MIKIINEKTYLKIDLVLAVTSFLAEYNRNSNSNYSQSPLPPPPSVYKIIKEFNTTRG